MKAYLVGIGGALAASLIGIASIVINTNPDTTSVAVRMLFLLALFVACWSGLTLVGYRLNKRFRNMQSEYALVSSFIQSFAVSFLLLVILVLRKLS